MANDPASTTIPSTPAFNDVEINIPSDLVFERVVRESAVVVARYLGLNDDRVADLQLAVSEAVTNAIEHGNHGDINVKVGVRFFVIKGQLAIEISDRGTWGSTANAFPAVPNEWDLEERLDHDLTRGMGMFLIHKLVDDVDVKSNPDGTVFTLWFDLGKSTNSLNIEVEQPSS